MATGTIALLANAARAGDSDDRLSYRHRQLCRLPSRQRSAIRQIGGREPESADATTPKRRTPQRQASARPIKDDRERPRAALSKAPVSGECTSAHGLARAVAMTVMTIE